MENEDASLNETQKRELVINRSFQAPVEQVYKAWTDQMYLAQWWGPKGFTNPVCELDVRPGGEIYIDMTGPDGTVYPMGGIFHEIIEPEKLVFTSTALKNEAGSWQLEVLNTVTFDQNGETKIKLSAAVVKSGPGTEESLAGMETGWNQSLDRLADLVEKMKDGK